MNNSIRLTFSTLILALGLCHSFAADTGARSSKLVVDASKIIGEFKPLRGVNGPPYQISREAPLKLPVDISAGYMKARVNVVRTHDSGVANIDSAVGELAPLEGLFSLSPEFERAVDMNVIFPDLNADPTLPESYNFGPTDELIAAICAIGADVLFRVGRRGRTTAAPPADLVKYGEIIRHVVLHYNKGWANGFNDTIRYWEVWNEPDLGRIWWRGTPEWYYRLYEAAAKAVKSADPNALIGGPTIAFVNEPTPYREGFLAYVRDNSLPLDFFSWHYYSVDANDPYDFIRIGREMRTLLDSYEFRNTQSILDEWNYDFRTRRNVSPMHHASFVVSSLIYMQDGDIDQEALYRADREFGTEGSRPTKTGQGLIAVGHMADTPLWLRASGGDTYGFAVQAGRSEDGGKVQILISNYEIPPDLRGPREGGDLMHEKDLFDLKLLPRRAVSYDANGGYDLVVNGLDTEADYEIERYRITGDRDFSLLDKSRAKGVQVRLQAKLPPPAIELVVIGKVYDYPDKKLWYDSTIYGGKLSAAKIVAGNGSEGFDIEKFINSEMGEKIMSMIKNELVIYGGDKWNHPDMIKYWTDRGVIKEIHNIDDAEHTWISYVPDYMMKRENTRKYPVVFSAHGGGGSLFEAENHGFVAICREKGFMVVAPENENSNPKVSAENLKPMLDEMEKLGYPIDRSRVYYTGMSAGGSTSLYIGLKCSKMVAAVAAHSSPAPLDGTSGRYSGLITQEMFNTGTEVPMWMAVGEFDFGQLPLSEGTITGLNSWLAMNGCSKVSASNDNLIGITADSVTVKKRYGVDYTFADYYNEQGVKMNRIIGIEGHPHWVTPDFAESAWEFMRGFSRDKNGKLIVTRK